MHFVNEKIAGGLDELRRLWDGTEEWVLRVSFRTEFELKVVFAGERPTLREIINVRRLWEDAEKVPLRQAAELLGAMGVLGIGFYAGDEAQVLLRRAEELGLRVQMVSHSSAAYVPVKLGSELEIEDEGVLELVVRKMLAAGVAVTSSR